MKRTLFLLTLYFLVIKSFHYCLIPSNTNKFTTYGIAPYHLRRHKIPTHNFLQMATVSIDQADGDNTSSKDYVQSFASIQYSDNLPPIQKILIWIRTNWFKSSLIFTAVYVVILNILNVFERLNKFKDPIEDFICFQSLYIPMMVWTLVLAYTSGSFKDRLSLDHRNTSALSILYPLLFIIYHGVFNKVVNPAIFTFCTFISSLTQLNSYQLLKTRVPSYDTTTAMFFMFSILEQFQTGVMLPLLFTFGHLESFEIFRIPFFIQAIYSIFYSWGLFFHFIRARVALPKGFKFDDQFAGWKVGFKGPMKNKFLLWDILFLPVNNERTAKSAIKVSIDNILSIIFGNIFLITSTTSFIYPYFRYGHKFMNEFSLLTRSMMTDVILSGFAAVQIIVFAGSMVIHKKLDRNKANILNGPWLVLLTMSAIWAFYKTIYPEVGLMFILRNFFVFSKQT